MKAVDVRGCALPQGISMSANLTWTLADWRMCNNQLWEELAFFVVRLTETSRYQTWVAGENKLEYRTET